MTTTLLRLMWVGPLSIKIALCLQVIHGNQSTKNSDSATSSFMTNAFIDQSKQPYPKPIADGPIHCERKFIRAGHPFVLSCPFGLHARWIATEGHTKDMHRYVAKDSVLHVAYAENNERFYCQNADSIYCYQIKYAKCNEQMCNNVGKCMTVDDGTGVPHYVCSCPYKTRGFDCGEKYKGIEWLVALLWGAVFGEVALMVIAICRHKHQRIYRGIINKKRFVDVLNESKKNA